MVIKMNNKEIEALNKKINNPNADVKCPRCGNVIIYREYACGCTAYCMTNGCIKDSIRGI